MKHTNKAIGIRVDGSQKLGLGHIMRCLALSDELTDYHIYFWVRDNSIIKKILKGRTVIYITPECGYQEELNFLEDEIRNKKITSVIVDFLEYPPDYLRQLKAFGVRLVSLHEYEKNSPHSDVTINYNAFKGFDNPYFRNNDCLGPAYIIFRREIRGMLPKEPSKEVKTILISMGGSDPNGITLKAIAALDKLSSDLKLLVHVGPAFKYREKLDTMIKRPTKIRIRENVAELADLMKKADIAIASGGNTMYELCYLGIPSIIISQNEHQHEFASELDRMAAVKSLGQFETVDESLIRAAVTTLGQNHRMRVEMSITARSIIDGQGIDRIKEKIHPLLSREQ